MNYCKDKNWLYPCALGLLALSIFLAACSTTQYRQEADEEAYSIIDEKGEDVPAMEEDFDVEREKLDIREELPIAPSDKLLPESENDHNKPLLLPLKDALRIAAINSREYRSRKESVFLKALDLSSERNRFRPHFFWNFRGGADYDSDDQWSVEGRSTPGLEWLFATGTRLSADLSTNAFRFLSGDPASVADTVFDLTLTQPLLRDSRIAVIEPLTQAERDMVYELRDFIRFQRRFMVEVLNDYYRVLENRQQVQNEKTNYDNLVRIRERAEALGEAGRLPELQVDRARQDELSASDSLERARRNYFQSLDTFKVTLAIEPETELVLDPAELEALHERDMTTLSIDREESINTALENRLDLVTARDRVEDAERKARVAENALKAGLDLKLTSRARTSENNPLDFSGGSEGGGVEAELDLPLERTDERNAYRQRLVELAEAERTVDEQRDNVVLEVTNRRRDFERAVSSYEIQNRSQELAEERVESTELLFEAGRATMRDVLDAREDLLRSQNRLTQTLIDVWVSSLELERDMDILLVEQDGQLTRRLLD